ncbi:MAG: cytochrome c [Betaproteobacteria bacterium]|nr:cytochrome c [Betaproteobacteria bacterium]
MRKIAFSSLASIAMVFGLVSLAVAQVNPNTLVSQRKAAMILNAKYFGPIYFMTIGRAPYDAAIVTRNAEYLSVISKLPWDDFQPTTAGAANTRFKEEQHRDMAKFRGDAEALQGDVVKLVAAARAGDQATAGAVARTMANACNSCHEAATSFQYRFPTK